MRKVYLILLCMAIISTTFYGCSNKNTPTIAPSLAPSPQGEDLNSFVPEGWEVIRAVEGDLNNDGLPDIAAVIEGKPNGESAAPRRLFIAFQNKGGTYTLAIQSDKAILKSDEGGVWGDPFDNLYINKGMLLINFYGGSRERWGYSYRFRYQDKGWFLIGLTEDILDTATGEGTTKDYDLLTGDVITTKTMNDDVKSEEKSNRGKKPLVNLQDFDPRNVAY